jgi:hypothetical protein
MTVNFRNVLVGRVTPCAPQVGFGFPERRARSDAPYQQKANVRDALAVGRAVLCTPSDFIRHSLFLLCRF